MPKAKPRFDDGRLAGGAYPSMPWELSLRFHVPALTLPDVIKEEPAMDKLTKVLLAATALGLWLNAAQSWQPARTQPVGAEQFHRIEVDTSSMALASSRIAVGVNDVVNGTRRNRKLCGN